ncbi:glycosyltransferase family 9 protein [Flavobacterium antarcticum]|uniref:glycosyltransferase family 9 protein n=1 Tax=Flavobacterium antarcticum TaxID=271155 RepID=UPI0003B43B79|nr:glycosyltransferase family 9 protein [Flavobacterium antarcticum]
MKILVIQHKMIGDVLISSLICENLRKAYPSATIHYLVNDNTTPVLEGNKSIDKIVLFKPKEQKTLVSLLKFAFKIRAEKYDLVIDAYSKLQSWIVTFLSGASRKISYQKAGRTFIYTDNVPKLEFPATNLGLAIERRLSLLEPLNLPIETIVTPRLFVSETEKEFAKTLFERYKNDSNRKTVMISLLGSDAYKTYPLDYMAKIVDFIGLNYDVNLLFNYFPKQIEDAKTVYELCSAETKSKITFDLLGNDLREFIAIMNQCDLIVGNDGGAINMAKALEKPSFILFSSWIEKKSWATFEDGISHTSVHLKDFKPELFENKSTAELKKSSQELYVQFEPELVIPKLSSFLNRHIKLNNPQ